MNVERLKMVWSTYVALCKSGVKAIELHHSFISVVMFINNAAGRWLDEDGEIFMCKPPGL